MVHGLYVEVEPIIDKFLPKGIHFFYECGGRGIGKTYGAMDLCRKIGEGSKMFGEEPGKFMYLRRTAVEAASVASPEACPFKRYNINEGYNISADFSTKLGYGNFYMDDECMQHIGYCAALSTFSNLRGIDFSDVSFILFDECIPESKTKAPLKNEAMLLLNMLETINRNRVLEGREEIVLLMLSNPIDLSSQLYAGLDFTNIITRMMLKGQERYTDYERSLHIEVLQGHKVSELKGENSALYKFGKGTGFNEEALSGKFVGTDLSKIQSVPLQEYKPLYVIEELICVYQHKNGTSLHISQSIQHCREHIRASEKERLRNFVYWKYKYALQLGSVTYDSFATKIAFDNILNYKR